jgi:hypothetical protein
MSTELCRNGACAMRSAPSMVVSSSAVNSACERAMKRAGGRAASMRACLERAVPQLWSGSVSASRGSARFAPVRNATHRGVGKNGERRRHADAVVRAERGAICLEVVLRAMTASARPNALERARVRARRAVGECAPRRCAARARPWRSRAPCRRSSSTPAGRRRRVDPARAPRTAPRVPCPCGTECRRAPRPRAPETRPACVRARSVSASAPCAAVCVPCGSARCPHRPPRSPASRAPASRRSAAQAPHAQSGAHRRMT